MIAEVEFRNVSKSFINKQETVAVLKEVSGKIEKGSIVTMIGPSGSGKSTILSLCNLLQTPDEGEIYIQGKEVRRMGYSGAKASSRDRLSKCSNALWNSTG